MADVDISYNNSVVASLSDSGTEVLDTKGKFMADDVTITYTKSGGGGGTTMTIYAGSLTASSQTTSIGGRTVTYMYYYGQAYIDSAKTTTVLESFDYDGHALKDALESADKIIVQSSGSSQLFATGFEADTMDDDYSVYYVNIYGLGVQLTL